MQNIILIFKGFIVGLGKIIPGVSGSLLAFSLGIYEKAIYSVTNFFNDIKSNSLFLGKIGLGVIIAIILFSKVIIFCLNNYYLYTISLFIGLICGTIPYALKKVKITKKKNIIYIFLAVIIVFLIGFFKNNNIYVPNNNVIDYLYIIIIGFLDATTMIIPGISGTATFMMLGCYNFVLNLFSNPFANFLYSFLFGIGLIIGLIVVSKLVYYLLKKYPEQLFLTIIGFLISSIIYLVLDISILVDNKNIFIVILLYLIGYISSYKLGEL